MSLTQEFYKKKREELGGLLECNSRLLLYSGKEILMSEDAYYPFHVNNNFNYLTGITDPEVVLILEKNDAGEICEKLFINKEDPEQEKWIGKKINGQEAQKTSGILEIRYREDLYNELKKSPGKNYFYFDFKVPKHESFDFGKAGIGEWIKNLELRDCYPLLAEMRLIKEDEEIKALKRANRITKLAFRELQKEIRPNIYEYELAAFFEYQIKKAGASELSFETIVASGENATILHYTSNKEILKSGELILFDLGARWNGYCGDISRTVSVNGEMTRDQERIWNIVFEVEKELIKSYVPGVMVKSLQEKTRALFKEKCLEKALIKKNEDIGRYYYHGIGHPIGLDTHDIRPKGELTLKPGMTMTVEPGLYIKELGIGVRIEDNLLISEDGCEVF